MIFHLPSVWTIALDFIVWLVIHSGVSMSVAKIKPDAFDPESWLYKGRSWEREGRIYKAFLGVRKWKRVLPDGAAVFKSGFRKKHLKNQDALYLQRFIIETCRAELAHWVIFVFSFLFFIWNAWWIGMIMVAYALIVNIPCIIAQRYNRARLKRFDRRCAERTLSQQTGTRT
ncbi:MAG: glycosyl-4,4'-diaponeurosporenoate acyltransferase [Dehalococcoidia bacterium]|nr:glycosyl-4,4'-diaponeurosporenoate acyltransferase [Dehalococcoidia bacterium]